MTRIHRLAVLGLVLAAIGSGPIGRAQVPASPQATGTLQTLFDQGRRLFEEFQYDQAVPVFDQLINSMTVGEIENPDLLVQVYEMRARARFALGDSAGAEEDFVSLLRVRPEFRLGEEISPRVVAIFDNVRTLTIGLVTVALTPPGDIVIDGRTYAIPASGLAIDLTAGSHRLEINRRNFAPMSEMFTITAGQVVELPIILERVSASIEIATIPQGVEVLLDGESRGQTPGTAPTASDYFSIDGVPLGQHRLQLRRDCYVELSLPLTVGPEDIRIEALELERATASVQVRTTTPGAAVFVDGQARGSTPADLTLCEGAHIVEVRADEGRFVDRREWRTGDAEAFEVTLRRAFPIVAATAPAGRTPDQVMAEVARALGPTDRMLIYEPAADDVQAAVAAERIPDGWLGAGSDGPELAPDVIRDLGTRLAARLGVQGVATVSAGADPLTVSVQLLAAGSGRPETVLVHLSDRAAQQQAVARLSAPMPPIVVPTMNASVVDIADVSGAVVVRAAAPSDAGSLTPGDTIVGAAGQSVGSVADLRTAVASVNTAAGALPLDVVSESGESRSIEARLTMVPDTVSMSDPSILYNGALLELRQRVNRAAGGVEVAAANLNLAIVEMHLGNWGEALLALDQVRLPDGPGVSAGTVAYLRGLCLEASGRGPEAQAAFTQAASAAGSRLSQDGPLVAPLASQKLPARR